jgi:dUTP pyrophosphatase
MTLAPRQRQLVDTSISIEIPQGTYTCIAPRSRLAWKNGIHIGASVVDSDYQGHLKVLMINQGTEEFVIQPADQIAQVIFELYDPTPIQEVQEPQKPAKVNKASDPLMRQNTTKYISHKP